MTGMIIADDELLIRQGLQSISWKDFGIEVRGVAVNGMEALSYVRSTDSKILLTDVRMPGMDGLKLIDAAREIVPDLKAILLTGYQDFSYAQAAIRLGAFGYILKPSNPDEIIRTVVKARKQIETERAEKEILLGSFLLDLIYGRLPESPALSDKCREFGLEFDNFVIFVAEFGFKHGETGGELIPRLKEEAYNALAESGRVNILNTDHSTICIIAELHTGGQAAREKALSAARELKDRLAGMFDVNITIGVSSCFSGPAHLFNAYNQAVSCLKMKFSMGRGAVIHIEDLESNRIIRSVLDYIEKYYMNDISLLTVSGHVHMNHIYLSRLVKKETGKTFLDILTRIRMEKACEMLRDSGMKAYEIAGLVGLRDSGYFSQVFKKYFGMTPSEYRERDPAKREWLL